VSGEDTSHGEIKIIITMEKDTVLNLIIDGFHKDFPFESKTNRVSLLETFGILEGINRKNGIFEILKKNSIFFYVGYGTIGFLNGIRICDLVNMKIDISFIDEILFTNKIKFKVDSIERIYVLENGVKIFFRKEEGEENLFVSEVIKTRHPDTEKRLRNIIF
jgi:hypothetical protein